MRRAVVPGSSTRTSRLGVAVLYLCAGLAIGSWIGRIPDVKARLDASDTAWGLANTLGAVGELVAFAAVAAVIGRVSTRRLAVVSAVGLVVLTPVLALASDLSALVLALFAWAVAGKTLGMTMGALALVEQHRSGRVLMGLYDAVFSAGMLAGGGVAWLAIRLGVSPSWQFAATNLVLAAGLGLCLGHLPDEDLSTATDKGLVGRLRLRLQPALLLLGMISFLASAIDSSVSQWGALLVTSMAGGDASWGALVYPAVMTAKIGALLGLSAVVRTLGWSVTLFASLAVVGAAVVVATTVTWPELALVGFALIGVGTAVLGPLVNTGAAHQPGLTAGEARTVLELGEVPAYLLLPAAIGVLSTQIGLSLTLRGAVLAAVLACALLGTIYRPARRLELTAS